MLGHHAGMWIDSHCHLDAPEFDADRDAVVARARAAGVRRLVLPAVAPQHFHALRDLAHRLGQPYALGLHPLWLPQDLDAGLQALAQALEQHAGDPWLVAVGEMGLDHFVARGSGRDAAALTRDRERQWHAYLSQLRLARRHGLPVILHVRRSADELLRGLGQLPVVGGIAHAFNGSEQQARRFLAQGLRLGFGGTLSFDRARQIRHLARVLPEDALVLETDAPDIPPRWLYRDAATRAAGLPQARNEPAELPRIGAELAALRGWTLEHTAAVTRRNACAALPRLAALECAEPGVQPDAGLSQPPHDVGAPPACRGVPDG
jgi:TatD DNase family protein